MFQLHAMHKFLCLRHTLFYSTAPVDHVRELNLFYSYSLQYSICRQIHVQMVSRHTVVCRAAQEAGTPHREYIDRKNENVIFTPLYLGDHLSDWNQICYTVARQQRESTFQI